MPLPFILLNLISRMPHQAFHNIRKSGTAGCKNLSGGSGQGNAGGPDMSGQGSSCGTYSWHARQIGMDKQPEGLVQPRQRITETPQIRQPLADETGQNRTAHAGARSLRRPQQGIGAEADSVGGNMIRQAGSVAAKTSPFHER